MNVEIYLKISDFFLQDKSRIIDIGSSTGTFLIELSKRHKKIDKKISFEGYDTVKEMIDFSKKEGWKKKVKFFKKDVNLQIIKNHVLFLHFILSNSFTK